LSAIGRVLRSADRQDQCCRRSFPRSRLNVEPAADGAHAFPYAEETEFRRHASRGGSLATFSSSSSSSKVEAISLISHGDLQAAYFLCHSDVRLAGAGIL